MNSHRKKAITGRTHAILTILTSLLILFLDIDIITISYIVLNLPLIMLELILAIWLIAKGFDLKAMNRFTEMEQST